jgi:hypothetical protein
MQKTPFDMSKEEQYTKAFNNGYILAEHEPHMLKIITENLPSHTAYIDGLNAGKQEYEFGKEKTALNELEELREKGNVKDRDFGR